MKRVVNKDDGGVVIRFSIPFRAPAALVGLDTWQDTLPWGSVGALSQFGMTPGPVTEPALNMVLEWPRMDGRPSESKLGLELRHLHRYSRDHALAEGFHAFGHLSRGADPPDVVAKQDSAEPGGEATVDVGVEATALTVPGRRELHALFNALRDALAASDPVEFRRRIGAIVYVWFRDPNGDTQNRPFRRADVGSLDALVESFRCYEPDPRAGVGRATDASPPNLPPYFDTGCGAWLSAAPLGAWPDTELAQTAGFEIALSYPTYISGHAAWQEIQRLVTKHDQAGVDILVITAGGPDRSGVIFPLEEHLARLIVTTSRAYEIEAPQHIREVVLHSWDLGYAFRIWPQPDLHFQPVNGSTVIAHSLRPGLSAARPMPEMTRVQPIDAR